MKKIGEELTIMYDGKVCTGIITDIDSTDEKFPYRVRIDDKNYWPYLEEIVDAGTPEFTILARLDKVETMLQEILSRL